MKRVLIVSPSNKGTIALRTEDLYKSFLRNKDVVVNIVYIYKFTDGFDIGDKLFCSNYSKSGFRKIVSLISEVRWLNKIKRIFRPDITISTLPICSVINVLSDIGDKKIGVFRAPYEQLIDNTKGWILFLYRYLFPKLDKLVGVSEQVTLSMKKHFPGIPAENFTTIYNAFFADEIRRMSLEKLDSLEEEKLFENQIILSVGRIEKIKAPERLIKAYCTSNLCKKYHLVFIGNDTNNLQDALTTYACENGVERFVHFLGGKKNPYRYMKRASFFASSSTSEGLPGVLIESLIVGTPVVSTDSSYGVWEIFSVTNKYLEHFNDILITTNGIITSNVKDEELNIVNLSKAFNTMETKTFDCEFPFEKRIDIKDVVSQYLS